ncbi:unnamed protein product [Cunninghamella blakesleeana]
MYNVYHSISSYIMWYISQLIGYVKLNPFNDVIVVDEDLMDIDFDGILESFDNIDDNGEKSCVY